MIFEKSKSQIFGRAAYKARMSTRVFLMVGLLSCSSPSVFTQSLIFVHHFLRQISITRNYRNFLSFQPEI